MSQRLMLGLCAAMLIVCCAALGITAVWLNRQERLFTSWQASSEARMKEQSELFSKMLANSEASSRDLSEQMRASLKAAEAAAAKAQPFSEWNPVELTFVTDGSDSRPVPGIEVMLQLSGQGNGQYIQPVQKVSDEHGKVRFERVRFGNINLSYILRLTDKTGYSRNEHITIPPGEGVQKTIRCPTVTPHPQPVVIDVEWPKELFAFSPALTLGDSFELPSESGRGRWSFAFSIAPEVAPLKLPAGLGSGGVFSNDTEMKCATVLSGEEVEMTTLQAISNVWGSGRRDRDAEQFFTEYPLIDVSDRQSYEKRLQWPGPEFRVGQSTVLLEGTSIHLASAFRSPTRIPPSNSLSRSGGAKGFGFAQYSSDDSPVLKKLDRSVLAIRVDLSDWQYTMEPGRPTTLRLKPSPAESARLVTAADRVDKMLIKLKTEAEQRQAEADKKIAEWEAAAPTRAAEAKRKAPFSEWNPVEFRFVEETSDGPPAKDLTVSFYTQGREKNDFPTVQTTTDEHGQVRLDRVRYGNYGLSVSTTDRGFSIFSITILPGEGLTKSFVVPKPFQTTRVALKINWPKEMADRSSALLIMDGEFFRSINPGRGMDSAGFHHSYRPWDPLIAGRGDSVFVVAKDIGYLSSNHLGVSQLNHLRFLNDSTEKPADNVPWPGPEWRLGNAHVMTQLSKDAAAKVAGFHKRPENSQLFGVSDSLSIRSWDQQWQPTTPPTVVLTPDTAGEKQLLEWLKRVELADRLLEERKTPSSNP